MNGLVNYDRRYSIANDEISLGMEHLDTSSISSSSSFGSSSCVPTPTHDPAKPISNDAQPQSPSPSQPLVDRWRIEEKDISEIPEIYPRLSYPLILRDREVSEIGDRLWAFLRTQDVRSAYVREQGRLLCCTKRVGFVVQFWRKISDNGTIIGSQSNQEIILEIQRRKGCSWAMQKIRSALKRAIMQPQQSSRSEPNLRLHRISPPTKRSIFPPPLKRNSHNAIGTIQPLLLPAGFPPLSRGEGTETTEVETSTKDISPPMSQTSHDESPRIPWAKSGLPPPLKSLTAIREPFSYSVSPPLRKNFYRSATPTSTQRSC